MKTQDQNQDQDYDQGQTQGPHYKYILPDGRIFLTEKTARKGLKVGTGTFRARVRQGRIQKILLTNTALSYEKDRNIQ